MAGRWPSKMPRAFDTNLLVSVKLRIPSLKGRRWYNFYKMVGTGGIEPPTSCASSKRSPPELRA